MARPTDTQTSPVIDGASPPILPEPEPTSPLQEPAIPSDNAGNPSPVRPNIEVHQVARTNSAAAGARNRSRRRNTQPPPGGPPPQMAERYSSEVEDSYYYRRPPPPRGSYRYRDDRDDDDYYYPYHYHPADDRGGGPSDYDRQGRDDSRHHPDSYESRGSRYRPPRAHLNRRGPSLDEADSQRAFFDDGRSGREGFEGGPSPAAPPPLRRPRRLPDEETGLYSPPPNGRYPRPYRGVEGNSSDTEQQEQQHHGGQQQQRSGRVNWSGMSPEERQQMMRLPWTAWMNSSAKDHFVASLGELVGTTLFLFFAFAGTEVANIQSRASTDGGADTSNSTTGAATGFDVSVLLYIALAFGFSLMVNVWVFFRISGGLFNPAVTFAMVLVRAIPPVRAACLFVAQILGAMLASVIVRFLFPESFNVRTTLGGGTTVVQGVFIEAILTAELVFTIFMLAKEKHKATFIAPVGIGLALFISEMVGVQFTGGSLNPARSFGPCVITATFDQEHWIYWVGPLGGSLIAVGFYKFIKTLEYEMTNPGADGDPTNDPTQNPEKFAEVKMSRSQSRQVGG